jgi:hypothetical protein
VDGVVLAGVFDRLLNLPASRNEAPTLSSCSQWASKPSVRDGTRHIWWRFFVVQDDNLKISLQLLDANPKSRLDAGIDTFIDSSVSTLFKSCEWRIENDKARVRRLIFVAKSQKPVGRISVSVIRRYAARTAG